MYAQTERPILMVVVKPAEMPTLKAIVHKYDPSAFIILTSAFEIIGKGFEGTNLTSTIHDDDDIED